MTASERLRELDWAINSQPSANLNYGRVHALNVLGDALPLIADVVEAAEWDGGLSEMDDPGFADMNHAYGQQSKRLAAALTALRDSLEKK